MGIITLSTDFGTRDGYVGAMKGSILRIAPQAVIVDVTHDIEPQDIFGAALIVKTFWEFFPVGTVHVVVVDPGVGGNREIVAVSAKHHVFIVPNNGVLTFVHKCIDAVYKVEAETFFHPKVSPTFHGRDIFAPVAAHVASGVGLNALGPPLRPGDVMTLDLSAPVRLDENRFSGNIISIDRFGNLITSFEDVFLRKYLGDDLSGVFVTIGTETIRGVRRTYDSVSRDATLALIGSGGFLEIAVNCGNAKERFNARTGFPVFVEYGRKAIK